MTKDHRSKWIGNDRGADLAAFEKLRPGFHEPRRLGPSWATHTFTLNWLVVRSLGETPGLWCFEVGRGASPSVAATN